ncbi:hypothetical protein GCM10023175_52020 [Pseudonocardia xishanensis]|uniref:Lsr2 protein n=1 Tax=Pseudonocardia xishanensis TaxID=630995 RepID=A0ABP8RY66_9PSEU
MTTARRRARAAQGAGGGKLRGVATAGGLVIDGHEVPPELLDPDAEVWHSHEAYLAFMAKHGWRATARDRYSGSSQPGTRRPQAAEGWAREAGLGRVPGPDGRLIPTPWAQLRAWGLC